MWQDPREYLMRLTEQELSLQWQQQQLNQQWHQWAMAMTMTPWLGPGYLGSSSYTEVVAHVQGTKEEMMEHLRKDLQELECVSWTMLQEALNITVANGFDTELSTSIERAIYFLDYQGTDSTPRGAVDALSHTTQALKMCDISKQWPLYETLDGAEKKYETH